MVRNYSRIRKREPSTPNQLKAALSDFLDGCSLRQASRRHDVSKSSLQRAVVNLQTKGEIDLKPHHHNRVFTSEQENLLVRYIINNAKLFYGLTILRCRKVAYELAVLNKIEVPQSWAVNGMAGIDWWYGFMKRYEFDISIRTPEQCSLVRAAGFNQVSHNAFFSNLEKILQRQPIFQNGCRTYNLDENGKTPVGDRVKVVAPKGARQVTKIKSGERGEIVTVCPIVCANGTFIPPVMIFPRKKFHPRMLVGAPTGTLGLAAVKGYMNSDLFLQTIEHFVKYTNSCENNPTLLILDNHTSHLSIAAINLAKENHVTLLTIPPHTSHKLQPLDVAIFSPFNGVYNRAVDAWHRTNPGHAATIYDVADFFGQAHDKIMTPLNIKSSFRITGIHPFKPDVFKKEDFVGSSVTVKPVLNSPAEIPTREIQQPPDGAVTAVITTVNINETTSSSKPNISSQKNQQNLPLERHNVTKILTNAVSSTNVKITPGSSTRTSIPFISPEQFYGYPKKAHKENSRKTRQKGKSSIITDTPEKEELERKQRGTSAKRKLDVSKFSNPMDSTENSKSKKMKMSNKLSAKTFDEGQYVLFKLYTKKNLHFKVGKIIEVKKTRFQLSILKKSSKNYSYFVLPNPPNISTCTKNCILELLPNPKYERGKRKSQVPYYTFDFDFCKYNVV